MTIEEFEKLKHGDAITINVDGKTVESEVFMKGGDIVECIIMVNGSYVGKRIKYPDVELVKKR